MVNVIGATIAETRHQVTRLTYYRPGARQAAHEHETSQISILLLGSLQEEAEGRKREIASPFLCFKPEGTVHSNVFGDHGALLLSVRFHNGSEHRDAILRKGWGWWRVRTPQITSPMSKSAFRKALGSPTEPEPAHAPDWLRGVRASLEKGAHETSIAGLARMFDVHRVHLSRCFTKHYGVTPSAFRLRHMAALALDKMVNARAPAALAAAEAGFADQSHMVRAIRQATGLTPGHIIRTLT